MTSTWERLQHCHGDRTSIKKKWITRALGEHNGIIRCTVASRDVEVNEYKDPNVKKNGWNQQLINYSHEACKNFFSPEKITEFPGYTSYDLTLFKENGIQMGLKKERNFKRIHLLLIRHLIGNLKCLTTRVQLTN